uniref:Uncharacterized protein n=1 Tax=Lotharella oceanica TaxID=641309 RepID=A0A7S2TPW9_9EUKA
MKTHDLLANAQHRSLDICTHAPFSRKTTTGTGTRAHRSSPGMLFDHRPLGLTRPLGPSEGLLSKPASFFTQSTEADVRIVRNKSLLSHTSAETCPSVVALSVDECCTTLQSDP